MRRPLAIAEVIAKPVFDGQGRLAARPGVDKDGNLFPDTAALLLKLKFGRWWRGLQSKYTPHQGKREVARRLRQAEHA